MKFVLRLLSALVLVVLAGTAFAHQAKLGEIEILHPWARATTGPNGAVFVILKNHGTENDRLIKAASPLAKSAELHTHIHEGDVMKMRPVEAIDLPAGGEAKLIPGGLHVMLFGLTQPLKEGTRIPLTLTFEKSGTINFDVMVGAAGALTPADLEAHPMEHMDHDHM